MGLPQISLAHTQIFSDPSEHLLTNTKYPLQMKNYICNPSHSTARKYFFPTTSCLSFFLPDWQRLDAIQSSTIAVVRPSDIIMSGLKCSVASCTYKTSDTISDDADISNKIKLLEIHTAAAHTAAAHQVTPAPTTVVTGADTIGAGQQTWMDQILQFQDYQGDAALTTTTTSAAINPPIVTVPVGSTPIFNVAIDQPHNDVESQIVVAETTPGSSPLKRKVEEVEFTDKKARNEEEDRELNTPTPEEDRELNTPTPGSSGEQVFEESQNVNTPTPEEDRELNTATPTRPSTPCYCKKARYEAEPSTQCYCKKARYDVDREVNTPPPPKPLYQKKSIHSIHSVQTQPVDSPPQSNYSSTFADDDDELSDQDLNKMLEEDVDDDDDENEIGDEDSEIKGKDYTHLFNEDDSFSVSDFEGLRRSLKFQTYLRQADRLDPVRFASFMTEFAQKIGALNSITADAHKKIDKEHHLLFSSILVSHFSKWTGLTFLNEAEIKKKNSLELSIKNFDSRILGKAKITKGKKK